MGEFQPEAHLKGAEGDSFTAFICNRKSAIFVAVVPIPMRQIYKVFLSDTELNFVESVQPGNSDDVHVSREDVIGILEKKIPPSKITITTKNASRAFDQFCSEFNQIDAAGGIVKKFETSNFLMILRNGIWDFPKGKLDEGEVPATTAIREVQEECGIEGLSIVKQLNTTYHGYMFKGAPTIKRTYWFLMECDGNKTPVGQLEEGITQVEWVSKERVEGLLKEGYGSLKDLWSEFNSFDQDTL